MGKKKIILIIYEGILWFYFPVAYNSLCWPQISHKQLMWNSPGRSAHYQEHFTTIVYAKFEGQTEWIMGNGKIENRTQGQFAFCGFGHFASELTLPLFIFAIIYMHFTDMDTTCKGSIICWKLYHWAILSHPTRIALDFMGKLC